MLRMIKTFLMMMLGLILLDQSTYTLQEYQQALVLQLGSIKGLPITDPGLHFKIPFVEDIKYFDKRILQWDGDRGEVPTKDKKFIWVDTTARWKILDALVFYSAVRDIPTAMLRMGPIIDGATKDIVSSHRLTESVRNSNRIMEDLKANSKESEILRQTSDYNALAEQDFDLEEVNVGREKLSELIAERARAEASKMGIAIIDVHIRSIAYQKSVEDKVFQSMISERNQVATKIRSSGKGEEAKILGQLDLALKKIESEAYKKSQQIIGNADAKATATFAEVLKDSPDFYDFLKSMETYDRALADRSEFVLATNSSFLKFLKQH